MKKSIFLSGFILFTFHFLYGQNMAPLVKQWDARFGGDSSAALTCFQQTSDGGYMLGGYIRSDVSGDVSQPSRGNEDYWIVKIDSFGKKQWDKRFGGTANDELTSLQQCADGGYILGGGTYSNKGGDVSESRRGKTDFWIVKTDAQGNKQWDKRFGGTDGNYLSSLQQTTDGGYILGGASSSGIGSDKTQASQGWEDYWVVKTDSLGNKQWDKRFGGSGLEIFSSLQQTYDGGYILGGSTSSPVSGDVTQSYRDGIDDYWIVKTDALGNKLWDKRFGGCRGGNSLKFLRETNDKGLILGGITASDMSCDVSQPSHAGSPREDEDYWIVKTDSLGNKLWDKRFGGEGDENFEGYNYQALDGGYIVSGTSKANISGDKTENNLGDGQDWIVKTDSLGNKLWDKTIFTKSSDYVGFAIQTSDGGYAVANSTYADTGGYKSQMNRGSSDYWIVKFRDTSCIGAKGGVITSSLDSICSGSALINLLSVSGNIGNVQWQSSINGSSYSDIPAARSGLYSTSSSPAQTSYYRAKITTNCFVKYSNTVTVYVTPAPAAEFTYTNNGPQVQFNSDSSSPGITTYAWDFGDGQTSSDTNPAHTFNSVKNYYVCLTVFNGSNCSSTYCTYVSTLNGIGNISANPSIQLYPNPANNTLNLSVNGLQGNYQLKVYNVLGQQVKVIAELSLSGNENIPIDLSDVAPGTYELVLMNDKEYFSKRFVHLKQ